MPKRGENIYKRKDGRWEGRYKKYDSNGSVKWGYVYAKTYREVRQKLQEVYGSSCQSVKQDISVYFSIAFLFKLPGCTVLLNSMY